MFRKDLLADKITVVTGGGSGLGLSMAKMFASYGARLVLLGRSLDKLEIAKADIELQSGGTVNVFSCDVRESGHVSEVASRIKRDIGPVEVLLNNAAGNFLCSSEDLSANAFKSIVDIVLSGTFHCTHAFGQHMIQAQKGNILNIVTTYAESGGAFVLPSACAKAGVAAMTRSLAVEWATYGIRVNAIAPGFFPTEGAWSRLVPPQMKFEEKVMERIPAKRLGNVEELAHLACYLLAQESAYLTGQVVTMDGGDSLVDSMFQDIAGWNRTELKKAFAQLRPKK